MKKILDYIKKNKIFCFIMFLGFVLLLLQMKNVVMYADDFPLKVISDQGWKNILDNEVKHYFNWGGGFTPLLVTSFLRFDFCIWKIIISFLIAIIIGLSIKMFNFKDKKSKNFAALFFWDCVFFVTILITRETIYWLDGSMAYVFTAFQIFIYIYVMITRIFYGKHNKFDYIILPVIAFLAGWSSAQTGAIAFMIPTLIILFAAFIKKIKVKFIYHLTNILGMIGFAIFYFAPGNTARMTVLGEFSKMNFIEKIIYRINNIYTLLFNYNKIEFTSITFFVLLLFSILICYGLYLIRKNKIRKNLWLIKFSTFYLLIFVLLNLYIRLSLPGYEIVSSYIISFENDGSIITKILPYIVCSFAMLASLVNCYYISEEENKIEVLFFPIIAYFSQGIMVMSPYSQYRTELIALVFIWPILALLTSLLFQKKEKILYIISIPFIMYSISFCIFLLLFLLYDNTRKKIELEFTIIISIFTLYSLINYVNIINKYEVNKVIYEKNISKFENYDGNGNIIIELSKYSYYGFAELANASWSEDSLRIIYNLGDAKIIKIGNENYEIN